MNTAKIGIADIAHAVGVSQATVSKALNNRPDVSAGTRRRVLDACRELGYTHTKPGAPSTPHIALVTDDLSSFYTLEILKGAVDASITTGTALVTTYLRHTPTAGDKDATATPLSTEWLRTIHDTGNIGLITVTTALGDEQLATIRELQLPLVAIDPASPLPLDCISIGATNWNGGVEATEHLIALGHRRIAFISGPEASVPSRERREGYLSALQMHALPVNTDLITSTAFSYDGGLDAARHLLDLPEDARPTAVFAGSDAIAVGVCEAARERGLRVPEDLSVIGFDDTELARTATPQLTCVHQPLMSMGARAVHTVVNLHRGDPSAASGPVRLSTHLVVRNSTAAPGRG